MSKNAMPAFLEALKSGHQKISVCGAAFLIAALVLANPAPAAARDRLHLVMIEEASCRYCVLWNEEVGTTYSLKPEGRRAPLVRLDINSKAARRFKHVVYTPTFILVRTDGWEIGRIVGYPGANEFWKALRRLLAKAGSDKHYGPDTPAPTPEPVRAVLRP